MKASVLVVFLALLIASISIGGCARLAKTTTPKIVQSSSIGAMTSGATEQDGAEYNPWHFAEQGEAEVGTDFHHIYG
jgi:hypothetical protein